MTTLLQDNKSKNDQKPEKILDYNVTKDTVDTLDQLVCIYTCKRKFNYSNIIMFYNMLDISVYNAFILWTVVNPNWNYNKLRKRKIFLHGINNIPTQEKSLQAAAKRNIKVHDANFFRQLITTIFLVKYLMNIDVRSM